MNKNDNNTCEEDCCEIDLKNCPVDTAVTVIGGKWKIPILYTLRGRILRFSEINRALPQVTQKMLTQQLRELERDGLVARKVYAEVPPKVEYSVTPLTRKLEPILNALCEWGKEYQALQQQSETLNKEENV